jgi:hypothetical protein
MDPKLKEFLESPKGKRHLLEHLANKYGDFKIAKMYKDKEGDVHSSKHKTVLACNETNDKLLYEANNRQIFESELVIDIDPPKGENPAKTKRRFQSTCNFLNRQGLGYRAYSTGSRGYHIHLIFPKLLSITNYERTQMRQRILSQFKGYDLSKCSNNVMIALEFSEHFKTGKPKTLIYDTTLGWEYEFFK